MKRGITLFLLFSIAVILYAKEHNDQLFSLKKYNLKWGMTLKEISKIKNPNLQCTDFQCYISDFQFLDKKYFCSLFFEEGKLTYYSFTLRDELTKSEGVALLDQYTHKISNVYGKNQKYKRENKLPEINQRGEHILYYDIASYWTRPDGKVHLLLTGKDDSCYLEIAYFSWMSFNSTNKEKTPKVEYEIDYTGVK